MIPKIIHYCWFGGREKPLEIKMSIDSWKRYVPEYEIREWNEGNFNIENYVYAKEAYEMKKWAFVSDVVRLAVLYRYGGIYLDVDVEFVKPLPQYFLEYDAFCGFEYTMTVAPGLIFGVVKSHPFVKNILDSYTNEHFYLPKDGMYQTINLRITEALTKQGLKKNNEFQNVNGIRVFPSEYFCGYDTDIREPLITDKTICWHHYLGTWQKLSVKGRCQNILKGIIGINNYKKVLYFIRKKRK